MDELAAIRTIDVTTTGRRTGDSARIEIWWFRIDDRFVIMGTPGPRDWYANVLADSNIMIHAGDADIPAKASPITDQDRRLRFITHPDTSWYLDQVELAAMVAEAPMIEITFPDNSLRPMRPVD